LVWFLLRHACQAATSLLSVSLSWMRRFQNAEFRFGHVQPTAALARILADAGYKGNNAPEEHKFKVYTQGQKRGVTSAIKRQSKRCVAIEPAIGHAKQDHRMDRNFLAHRQGDAINAVLTVAGYNFRRMIQWLRLLLRVILQALAKAPVPQGA